MQYRFLSHILKACAILPLLLGVLALSANGAFASSPEPADITENKVKKPKNLVPGPIISPEAWPGGTTLPKGVFAVVNHATMARGTAYKGGSRHTSYDPAGNKAGPKSNDMFVNVLKLRYGLGNGWDIRTSSPFLNIETRSHNKSGTAWRGGIADTTIVLRKQLKERTDESPFCIAADLGVVVPTGHTGDKNKYLATNAFGVVFGGGTTWIDHNQRADFDIQYKAFTEGKHDIRPGNIFLSHAHYAYAFSAYFDLGAETWFRFEEASRVNGHSDKNSYTEWYAGPKMQFKIPQLQNMNLGTAVLFPVYRHYESTKVSADTRLEFRVSVAF